MRSFRGRIGAIGVGAMIMTSAMPAHAAPSCWRAPEAGAAQVREMQTVLMVAALRCRAAGIDISAAYDGFVVAQRGALAGANLLIKQHFAAQGGAQADYDRFTTALANGHGDDETTQATCAEATALAQDAAGATAADALEQIAAARVFPAILPGGACDAPRTVTMAVAITPNGQPSTKTLEPQPVTLSPEVVAALTVLARYQTASGTAQKAEPTQVAVVGPR